MVRADLDQFRLYPRGFLGAPMDIRIEASAPKPEPRMVYQTDLSLVDAPVSTVVPNPTIETLYAKYIRNAAESMSFDFRKRLWIVALQAFGTNNFRYWYEQQHLSPRAGDMHRRFLEDTLRFIVTGKQRSLDIVTGWNVLVTLEDSTDSAGRVSDISQELFRDFGMGCSDGLEVAETNARPANFIDTADVIQAWVSRVNGTEDLLLSLHVLFGDI